MDGSWSRAPSNQFCKKNFTPKVLLWFKKKGGLSWTNSEKCYCRMLSLIFPAIKTLIPAIKTHKNVSLINSSHSVTRGNRSGIPIYLISPESLFLAYGKKEFHPSLVIFAFIHLFYYCIYRQEFLVLSRFYFRSV